MGTLNQLLRSSRKLKKHKPNLSAAVLKYRTQREGTVIKIFTRTPRKPNSAIRKVATLEQTNEKFVFFNAFIPGEGEIPKSGGKILTQGRRVRDLPGIKCRMVRGRYDCFGISKRKNRRSLFGAKKPKDKI